MAPPYKEEKGAKIKMVGSIRGQKSTKEAMENGKEEKRTRRGSEKEEK